MYNIQINNIETEKNYKELILVFLKPEEFTLTIGQLGTSESDSIDMLVFNRDGKRDRDAIKREIFIALSKITGKRPKWGILTGVRPVKLAGDIYKETLSYEDTIGILKDKYLVKQNTAEFILDTYLRQIERFGNSKNNRVGLYIGIPFCPTRCLYCAFASNQVEPQVIDRYIVALKKEIQYVGDELRSRSILPETIYIGGGTPTTLNESQLEDILRFIRNNIDFKQVVEYCVEAGRPDTITPQKLHILKEFGVTRISINPQTMKDETLQIIGRNHTSEEIRTAFEMAHKVGLNNINADIIAGLPGEVAEDFNNSLKEIIGMKPSSITVHTLAVKRASRLKEVNENYHYDHENVVMKMIDISHKLLSEHGFIPYYMYRQKHMSGALENIGYCLPENECIYNIRIMEERQTIIALGAGGISKVYYANEDRLERIPNVTNYEVYISRIDEMIDRKRNKLFV